MSCIKIVLALCAALALTSCESSTEFGRCIGLTAKTRDPRLTYEFSARNIVVGIVFFEMIAPPIIVALKETYCPIANSEIVRTMP